MRLPWRCLVCGVAVVAAAACGKKGPPLPPLVRLPAAVAELSALRADDIVFLTVKVPDANVGGDTPGDVGQLEIYAVTAEREPELAAGLVPPSWTLVATVPVRRPVLPLPVKPGEPAPPPLPVETGLDQGQVVTFQERLTAEALVPAPEAPSVPTAVEEPSDAPALSLPPVAPAVDRTARRFYAARALSRRGRPGAWSAVRGVPLATPFAAPTVTAPTYDDASVTVTWTPPPGAAIPTAPPAEDLLPARPMGLARAAARYNIYEASAPPTPDALGVVTRPAPLNGAPIEATTVSAPGVAFGTERCFVVRAVATIGGVDVEGAASAPTCVTPVDTFAPPPPAALEAVAGAGVISLIWEAVEAPDLAGYLVYRGEAPGEPTTALTPEPIRDSSFEDRSVTPGVRYVYVVVAVDSATPANRSDPSNQAEETARQ